MNGESVPLFVEEFFRPLRTALDYIFAAGVTYGVSRLVALSWRCWRGFRVFCLPFGRCSRSSLKERFGEWAVVVGATSGIGQAYAEELARQKMNVVLISKSYDDLVQLVAKIQSEYSVQACGIHADFLLGRHVYQEIDDALQGYEIGILVNNVAVNYDHPQFFVLIPPQRLMQILDVNITATTVMTYMLLPQMLERQRGAVINICSQVATLPPSPLLTAYSASMAYIQSFSESLHLESKRRGIIVQTLLPCFVASPNSPPSFFTPTPTTYVTHAIATLGVATTTCGYWPHSLQSWLCSCISRWLWVWLVSHLFRRHRLFSIAQAKEQGTEQFTRRRRSTVVGLMMQNPNQRPAALRRVSGNLGLTLRRSPSPKRKVSGGLSPAVATPFRPLDPFHPPLARGDTNTLPGQPFSSASVPSPIPGSPLSSPRFFPMGSKSSRNSNLPPTFNTSTPLSTPPEGGGNSVTPKRSLSSSSAPGSDSLHQRWLPIRHSRVMVMPSVARYSQQSLAIHPGAPANHSTLGETAVSDTAEHSDSTNSTFTASIYHS